MKYAPKSEIVTAYQYDGSYKSLKDILSLMPNGYSLQVEVLKDDGTMDSWVIRNNVNRNLYFPVGTWIVKKESKPQVEMIEDDIFNEIYTAI